MKFPKVYGQAEGPLGIPMQDAFAREVEALLKTIPAECKALVDAAGGVIRRKAAPVKFELLPGERADVSLITTDAVDRDREVVLPGGGDWKSWTKGGGVVTFAHNYEQLPVGRALWIKRVEEPANGWLAKTRYTPRPDDWRGDWFPDAVFAFVQDGMRGKSIGFIPLEGSPPTEKDLTDRPELAGVRFIIRRWVGLEYAVAPIQSNPDAVAIGVSKMRAKGLTVPQCVLDELGMMVPEGADFIFKQEDPPPPPEPAKKPEPGENETQDEFMGRCMAYPDLQDKPQDQRAAICNSLWEQAKGKTVKTTEPPPPPPAGARVIPPKDAAGSRTPAEVERATQVAALQALEELDIPTLAAEAMDRMRGKV